MARLRSVVDTNVLVSGLRSKRGTAFQLLSLIGTYPFEAAVGEKMAALMTETYLEERAKRGSRQKYERVLAKVPDVEPGEADRLPEARRQQKSSKLLRRR